MVKWILCSWSNWRSNVGTVAVLGCFAKSEHLCTCHQSGVRPQVLTPRTNQGDCKMHGAKFSISPRGGVNWSDLSQCKNSLWYSCGCCPTPIHQVCNVLLNFPIQGHQAPFHPLEFPNIFPWLAWGSTPGASWWHTHYEASRIWQGKCCLWSAAREQKKNHYRNYFILRPSDPRFNAPSHFLNELGSTPDLRLCQSVCLRLSAWQFHCHLYSQTHVLLAPTACPHVLQQIVCVPRFKNSRSFRDKSSEASSLKSGEDWSWKRPCSSRPWTTWSPLQDSGITRTSG